MIRVNIKDKLSNVITHSSLFESQEQADIWIDENKKVNAWGKPERILSEHDCILAGENIEDAVQIIEDILIDHSVIKSYKFLASFEIVQLDASLEKEKQDAIKILAQSDYKILRHIGQKALNVQTSLSEEQYIALENIRQAARNKLNE